MSYPASGVQKGIYDALHAAGLTAYDTVPTNATFPYVTISDAQVLDDGNTCEDDMFEVFVDLHIWSRPSPPTSIEAKTIAATIHDALLTGITVSGWRVTATLMQTARHFRDQDGITNHSVLTYRFNLEPA